MYMSLLYEMYSLPSGEQMFIHVQRTEAVVGIVDSKELSTVTLSLLISVIRN